MRMEALAIEAPQVAFEKRVPKPWGHEVVFTPPDLPYVGKVLNVMAGRRLSLQIHDRKLETLTLCTGAALLLLESADGVMESIKMEFGVGYTVRPGRKHRLIAVTDAAVLEASTPEEGVTVRLEDDFGRPDELLG